MNPSETLLSTLVNAAEGTRKEGMTVGGVTFTLNQAGDTVTGTFTIPVTIGTDAATGALVVAAQDFLVPKAPPAPPAP